MKKVEKGSDYIENIGKSCIVNAATFHNKSGTIIQLLPRNKYLVRLDESYLNKKSNKITNLCQVNCTQVWV